MNESHYQLREALVRRLANCAPEDVWSALGAAGVLGLRVPEDLGGLSMDSSETEPVMDALGALCLPTSYIETSIIAAGVLKGARTAYGDTLLQRIAKDGAVVGVAGFDEPEKTRIEAIRVADGWRLDGTARVVIGAQSAAAILLTARVEDSIAVFITEKDASDMTLHAVPTIDGHMAADISFTGTLLPETALLTDAQPLLDGILDEATAALSVEAAAIMRRLVDDTVAYAKQREQFGQPIGAFQVVQHKLVDMHIQVRRAAAAARMAMDALGEDEAVRSRAASAAKVTICQTGRFIGQNAVQLHGGMGMTEELPIGTCFKRLTVIESQLGGADRHLRRYWRLRTASEA